MKRLLVLFILFAFVACQNQKKKNVHNLTNGVYKYWDIIQKPSSEYYKSKADKFPVYSYYFDINGNFDFYIYDRNIRKQRLASEYDDVPESKKWDFESLVFETFYCQFFYMYNFLK